MKNIILNITIFLCVSCSYCHAQEITSVTDTINGLDFGEKTTAAPVKWSNFEDGTDGLNIKDVDSDWVAIRSTGGKYSTVSYSGDISAYNNVTESDTTGFYTNRHRFTASDEVYYYYKYRIDVTGNDYAIVKPGRITSGDYSDPDDYGQPSFKLQSQPQYAWSYINLDPDSDSGDDAFQKTISYIPENEWNTIEMYWKLSDAGVANGDCFFYVNGADEDSRSDIVTRSSGETYQLDSVILGLMATNLTADGNISIYIDDVYVDNTQARVFVAENSDSSGNREIQIPTAWSDTEITVTYNQGSFANQETCYLFVIDSDGTASAGYEGYFQDGTFYGAGTGPARQRTKATNIQFSGSVTLQ